MNNMMKPQEMFGALWKVAGPRQRKIMRRISFIGEKKVKPALARLQIVSEHCVTTGQQDLLFEAGLIDYSELEVINEGWMDDLKNAGSGLVDRATAVAKAGTELVRRPPQKGEFKDEADVLELFKLVGMQYGGVDVQGVKKELGKNWDDLKGAAGGAKEALVQAMKTVKGAMKDLLGQVGKLNEWMDKQGRKFQEIGIVQWVDKTVDDKLANFNKALQAYQAKQKEPGSESESKEDATPKLIQYASKIGEYARKHPIKAALPIVILTMAVTLLVGPIAAIAVGLFLRTGMGMIKSPNEKFSSALGSAAKVAAVGLAAGGVADAVGDAIGGGAEAGAEGAAEAGVSGADAIEDLYDQFPGPGMNEFIDQLTDQNWSPDQIRGIIDGHQGHIFDQEDFIEAVKNYKLENPGVTPAGGMGFPGAEGAPGAELQTGPEIIKPGTLDDAGNALRPQVGDQMFDDAGHAIDDFGDPIEGSTPDDFDNAVKAAPRGVDGDDLLSPSSGETVKVLSGKETQELAKEFAAKMGLDPSNLKYSAQGSIPTVINGTPVPDDLLSPEHIKLRDMADQVRRSMMGDSHNLTGPVLFEAKNTTDTSEYML